jgi:outer membrane lipoprotein-sorting protein
MWQRRRILLTALALVSAPAAAQSSPPPIDELMRRLAAVSASRASFTEEKTIAALTEPVRGEGWLVYRRPDHLEKTTTGPNRESLMVDGDRLSIIADDQPPRIIELDSEPALRGLVDAVRGTLAGDLATLQRSYDVAMQGNLAAWRLILTPRDPSLKQLLRQVTVEGAGTDLGSVRIVQANGDQSLMTIRPAS